MNDYAINNFWGDEVIIEPIKEAFFSNKKLLNEIYNAIEKGVLKEYLKNSNLDDPVKSQKTLDALILTENREAQEIAIKNPYLSKLNMIYLINQGDDRIFENEKFRNLLKEPAVGRPLLEAMSKSPSKALRLATREAAENFREMEYEKFLKDLDEFENSSNEPIHKIPEISEEYAI
jgi:hypothetical protein